jgi:hypothetical protein
MMPGMPRHPVARVGASGIVVLVGLLAGCGGGDDAATIDSASTVESIDPAPSTSDAPVTAATTTEPPTSAPPATEPPTTEPPATEPPVTEPPTDDGACLVGAWVVTESEMDAYYAGVMSTVEAPLTIDTTGSAPLTFSADGTYAWAPAFALTVEVAGQTGTGDVGGTITGNWTAADGVVTTSADVNALAVSITVNGVTFDGDDLANGLLNSSPVNGVTYSCEGPTPVLDFKTAEPTVTVPVTLTPA